jgi:uncharacterized membrane protein (DUF485 family)
MKEICDTVIFMSAIAISVISLSYALYEHILIAIDYDALRGILSLLMSFMLTGILARFCAMIYEKFKEVQ